MTTTFRSNRVVGFSLRKVLMNIDIKLLYARETRDLAKEEMELNNARSGKVALRKSTQAKITFELYEHYIERLETIRASMYEGVEKILDTYGVKEKAVWKLYFLENESTEAISEKLGIELKKLNRVILTMQDDLEKYYYNKGGNQ